MQPTADVRVAIVTDGLTDVKLDQRRARDASADRRLRPDAGSSAARSPPASPAAARRSRAPTSAPSSTTASRPGSSSASPASARPTATAPSSRSPRRRSRSPTATGAAGTFTGAIVSQLVRQGLWTGNATFDTANRRLVRADGSSWLADGFLEGQRVRVCTTDGATCADFKIGADPRRQRDPGREARVHRRGRVPVRRGRERRRDPASPPWPTFSGDPNAANAWYKQQRIEYGADTAYSLPPGRENVVTFPAATHLLTKLLGPLDDRRRPRLPPTGRCATASSCRASATRRCSASARRRPRATGSTS